MCAVHGTKTMKNDVIFQEIASSLLTESKFEFISRRAKLIPSKNK